MSEMRVRMGVDIPLVVVLASGDIDPLYGLS